MLPSTGVTIDRQLSDANLKTFHDSRFLIVSSLTI